MGIVKVLEVIMVAIMGVMEAVITSSHTHPSLNEDHRCDPGFRSDHQTHHEHDRDRDRLNTQVYLSSRS